MIKVIDIGICNIGSLLRALGKLDVEIQVTRRPDDLANASMIILPGVGSFGEAMARLNKFELVEPIRHRVLNERLPILGICLGMQLLFDQSDEHGEHVGLGILAGDVQRLPQVAPPFRIPNIGWCNVTFTSNYTSGSDSVSEPTFYFTHSHRVAPADASIVTGTFRFGGHSIPAMIGQGTVHGVQFHPEKSQDAGITLLRDIIEDANPNAFRAKSASPFRTKA